MTVFASFTGGFGPHGVTFVTSWPGFWPISSGFSSLVPDVGDQTSCLALYSCSRGTKVAISLGLARVVISALKGCSDSDRCQSRHKSTRRTIRTDSIEMEKSDCLTGDCPPSPCPRHEIWIEQGYLIESLLAT